MSEGSITQNPSDPGTFGYDWRCTEASSFFPPESIQHLSREDAARCQSFIGHGKTFGIWETPEAMIGGRYLKDSHERIHLRERIIAFLPDSCNLSAALDILLDEAVLQLTRYALLLRLGASGKGKATGRSLDATTVFNRLLAHVPRILARSIVRRIDSAESISGIFLRHLEPEDVIELRKNKQVRIELDRMSRLAEMRLWHDIPPKHDITRTTNPKGEREKPKPEEQPLEHQPIPDDYLEEMGPRVLWIVEELGPNLLHLLEAIPELVGGKTNGATRMRRLARYFSQNTWRNRNGDPLIPPFPLRTGGVSGAASANNPQEWPPRHWEHVQNLSVTLQSAHLWIALLAMAGRDSEAQTLKRNCVSWDRDGKQYAGGKTYKLSPLLTGEERDWPAPEALVLALGQQRRLVDAWARIIAGIPSKSTQHRIFVIEDDHLWASLGRTGSGVTERLSGSTPALMLLATRVGLTDTPGGINLHPHRFRKTIARLMAIAVVDSPRILKKLLGHKDIAMTLHYILADKAIQAEIIKVEHELRIMRAKVLIEEVHTSLHKPGALPYGGYGGGAMPRILKMVIEREAGLHQQGKEWGAEDTYELASILTVNGRYWRITAPGVLCLKPSPRQTGACTCDSSCENRVEDEIARRDVLEGIEVLIDHGRRALAENDLILLSRTITELYRDTQRFEDIAAQYRNHPDIHAFREALL